MRSKWGDGFIGVFVDRALPLRFLPVALYVQFSLHPQLLIELPALKLFNLLGCILVDGSIRQSVLDQQFEDVLVGVEDATHLEDIVLFAYFLGEL